VPNDDQQLGQTTAASPDLRGVHLLALVRALARQAARDWLAGSSHTADQIQTERVIDDQA
jgi:hypothetical protein